MNLQTQDRLLLIDATAMAYRAFYAIVHLSTSAGVPTNALYGFIKLLRQLEQTWKPTHWAAVLDGGLPQQRMALLETYKAQRKEMPDSLRQQLGLINEFIELADVPLIRLPNEEADDALATLAECGRQAGMETLIATSDKDMFQLVDDKTFIVPLTKGNEKMSAVEVEIKTGVRPQKIVSWLALTGDTADNIPGVPGVGPKTAAKLLNEYGSLANLWANVDRVSSEKLRAALIENKAIVERNVQLMSLQKQLPCPLALDDLRRRDFKPQRLFPFFQKMEFRGLAKEMEELSSRLF